MMEFNWSWVLRPLLGGVLIGLASWWLLAAMGRVAGISGIVSQAIAPDAHSKPSFNFWRWAFIGGLVLGGAAAIGMGAAAPASPVAARPVSLLLMAGLLVGLGTVMGAGCTSGHGVCGLGRRSVRSLVATLVFMGSGVATVGIVGLVAR